MYFVLVREALNIKLLSITLACRVTKWILWIKTKLVNSKIYMSLYTQYLDINFLNIRLDLNGIIQGNCKPWHNRFWNIESQTKLQGITTSFKEYLKWHCPTLIHWDPKMATVFQCCCIKVIITWNITFHSFFRFLNST